MAASPATKLFDLARKLPPRERRRLVSALEGSLLPSAAARRPGRRGPGCASLLALAGTAHADASDVSSNKYAHLADIYADRD
jgi:hypothetical protein